MYISHTIHSKTMMRIRDKFILTYASNIPTMEFLFSKSSSSYKAWIQYLTIIIYVCEGSSVPDGYSLELAGTNGINFYVYINNSGWQQSVISSLPANQWVHVAGTYDGTNISLYLNGVPAGPSTLASGTISPSGNNLQIGHDAANPSRYFHGLIDDASVYNRALSASEISAIYNAGKSGKCPAPPVILTNPASQTVQPGAVVTFTVNANGNQPLSYQWIFNSSNITGATNASLILTNIQ